MAELGPGSIVGRYRLDERLGAGTFGEVWRASQLTQGQDVGRVCAIKLMRVDRDARSSSSVDAVATGWIDEVRALQLAKNRHAGTTIPDIFDADVWEGHAYIAMEMLGGRTVASRLDDGPIPWRRALFIGSQIAQALEAAHAEGIIHRDLKPQNVILVDDKRSCVIDWGIARLSGPAPSPRGIVAQPVVDGTEAEPPVLTTSPRRPALIGTPGYIAPEAYEGAMPTPALDVFALGVVMYEMLTGRLPHDLAPVDRGSASADTVRAFRSALDRATQDHAFVPLRGLAGDLPAAVIALVDSLLALEPERRPRRLREAFDRVNRYPWGIPDPPYVGLGKLGREHAGLFFGQDDAIDSALVRLETQRGILLWGPSGSGKSSLAVAGVAASADRRLFLGTDGWTIEVLRPREALTLDPASGPASSLGRMIVLDQLEEIVDLAPQERDQLAERILQVLDVARTDKVRIVATIRDDLEWRVDREVPALRPLLERRIIVKGVDANHARAIIAEPARASGYEVEELDLVSREVEDRLSADPAKLPVVQFALSEWWQRRDAATKKLPITAWRELGGVDGTLSFVAEKFYARLSAEEQERLHAVLLRFFSGRRRRAVPMADIDEPERALVDQLVQLRLVARRERKGERVLYEVEHESLTHWSRLASWLDEAREDRALHEDLERDAAAWAETRDPERLWKKRRLIAGEDVVRRGHERSSDVALEFLRAGRAAARRGLVTIAVVLGTLITLAGILAVWQIDKTTKARNEAIKSERIATLAKLQAEEAADDARRKTVAAQESEKRAREALEEARRAEEAAKRATTVATRANEARDAATLERQRCEDLRVDLVATKKKLEDKSAQLEAELVRKQAVAKRLTAEELARECTKLHE